MNDNVIVMKLGGSLFETAPYLLKNLQHYVEYTHLTIFIIPGGGIFADNIRKIDAIENLSTTTSHWMAILAMEQYGYYLADKSGIATVNVLDNMTKGIKILLPYNILLNVDPLPHTWNVTSDSIAGWIANMLCAKFIKATDVDGIIHDNKLIATITAPELQLIGTTCVDSILPNLLIQYKMDCHVVNGRYPDRVIDTIEDKAVIGTIIKGNI